MTHPLVACIERELGLRRAVYAKAVRDGRMDPKLARQEYDRMDAVLAFLTACDLRFVGEKTYEAGDQSLPILAQIAGGDGTARQIWFNWMQKENS
jgi:hypothetical protein